MARRRTLTVSLVALVLLAVGGVATASMKPAPTTGIVPPAVQTMAVWTPDNNNTVPVKGKVVVKGRPVSDIRVRVDNYDVTDPTDAQGKFSYNVDHTLLYRHVVTITDASEAKVGGQPLSAADQEALIGSQGEIDVAYAVKDLKVSRDGSGQPVVSGRLAKTNATPPPNVGLLTYQLRGTVTDSDGKPVQGAQVSTRTLDRDYWTISLETDKNGRYESLFTASAEAPGDPVPFTVRVSKGDVVYQFRPQEFVNFDRLKSAKLDIKLPPKGYAMAIPQPQSYPGAIYTGTVAGVTSGDKVVRPVSATWPDRTGRFSLTLPKSLAGKTVWLWQGKLNLFSVAEAKPGSAVDLQTWPTTLPREAPRNLLAIKLK